MPTPNQPIHLEHLRFALLLARNYQGYTAEPQPRPDIAPVAKELILAARAVRRTRSSVERRVITTWMHDVLRPFSLTPLFKDGQAFVVENSTPIEIPR
jgi:hypothetical protein